MVLLGVLILSLLSTIGLSFGLHLEFPTYLWLPILIFIGFYIAILALYFIILFIWSLFYIDKIYDKQNKFVNFVFNLTLELLLHLGRVKVIPAGLDKVPHDKKYIFVYNHTSNYDPIVASYYLRQDNLIHISKPGNFKKPIAGGFIRRNCYMELNREDNREGLKVVIKAAKYLGEGWCSIGVSPEGTRNQGNPLEMLPFRNGCFKIALLAKCPIVICSFKNMYQISKNAPFKRTKVEMNVLDVLYYEDFKDWSTLEIGDYVRNLIDKSIKGEN